MTQLSNKVRILAKYATGISAVVLLAGSYMVADLQSVTGNAPITSIGEFIADYSLLTEIRLRKSHDRLLNSKIVRSRRTKGEEPLLKPEKVITGYPTSTEREKLSVVWLLGFPFAGSNVALELFEDYTGYSMGTNYGDILLTDQGYKENVYTSEPIHSDEPNGPFRFDMDKPLPPFGNILVKTHCGGYCFDIADEECLVKPYATSLWSLRQFLVDCGSGTSYKQGGIKEHVSYNLWKSKKSMVLVRHPIEIVLARFVNYMEGPKPKQYTWNRAGIEQYCKDYDDMDGSKKLIMGYALYEAKAMARNGEVLCHAELYKITKFYNNVFKALRFMQEPVHIVHFEDYDTDMGGTIQGMMDFMEYRVMENARQIPFNRTAEDDYPWFSDDQISAMMKFVNLTAMPVTSNAFAPYV